jgi:hypothetical protein
MYTFDLDNFCIEAVSYLKDERFVESYGSADTFKDHKAVFALASLYAPFSMTAAITVRCSILSLIDTHYGLRPSAASPEIENIRTFVAAEYEKLLIQAFKIRAKKDPWEPLTPKRGIIMKDQSFKTNLYKLDAESNTRVNFVIGLKFLDNKL